jgi:DNA-binding NarL/FixJ family response regulator
MQKRIRIVIADDHAVLRDSLAALLQTQRGFEVCAVAATGTEAVSIVQKCHPDVLVLDLLMPEGDGFEVLRALDRSGLRVASVVLTASENPNDYVQAVRLGARGLVLKGDHPEKLFNAIRSVANGEIAFAEEISRQVLGTMASESRQSAPGIRRLSEREKQIAYLVSRGLKNRDIASELNISENTVKRHMQSIFAKTGSRDRLELAVLALTELSQQAA